GGWPACFAPLAPLAFGEGQGPDGRRARFARQLRREEWFGRLQGLREAVMRDLAESRRTQDSRELASDSEESSSGVFMKNRTRQREFGFMGWGGKRRGAGRKPKGERAGVSHAKRPKLAARFPVSITLRLLPGLRTLRENGTHARIRELLAASTTESFRVIEYSVLSNHVHFLAESSDERALS